MNGFNKNRKIITTFYVTVENIMWLRKKTEDGMRKSVSNTLNYLLSSLREEEKKQ